MPPTACIHIIDDDEAVRESLAILLETHGFRTACHSRADAFLEAAAEGGCIVTDAQMPGLSGVELIRTLRSRGDARPAILITARGGSALTQVALTSGATTVLEKPFAPEILIAELRRAIGEE